MEDFKAYLNDHQLSKSLIEGYCWCTRLFLEWLVEFNIQPKELQLSHFQGYINHLQEVEEKEYKVRLTIAALRNYGYMLVVTGQSNEKLAMELYIKGIYKEPFPSLFEWEELEEIYQEFSTPGIVGQRNRIILSLFFFQGLTPEEIITIHSKGLDLEAKTIAIPKTYKGKARILNIEEHQVPLLQEYMKQVRPRILFISNTENNMLFISTSGNSKGRNITDNLRSSLKNRYPQITSYAQIRASVLHHWYTLYGLEKTIAMAGQDYIPTSPTK